MKIIKQEIQFEENLKQRLKFICEFSKTRYISNHDTKDLLKRYYFISEIVQGLINEIEKKMKTQV